MSIVIETRQRWLNLPILITAGLVSGLVNYHGCLKQLQSFQSHLDASQQALYQEICKEREHIFYTSLAQGVIIGILYLFFSIVFLNRVIGYGLFCESLAIVVVILYLFYQITTKKKNMLLDGNLSEEDVKEWYKVYQCMERQFNMNFIIGFLVVGFALQLLDIVSPPARFCLTPRIEKKKNKTTKKK